MRHVRVLMWRIGLIHGLLPQEVVYSRSKVENGLKFYVTLKRFFLSHVETTDTHFVVRPYVFGLVGFRSRNPKNSYLLVKEGLNKINFKTVVLARHVLSILSRWKSIRSCWNAFKVKKYIYTVIRHYIFRYYERSIYPDYIDKLTMCCKYLTKCILS